MRSAQRHGVVLAVISAATVVVMGAVAALSAQAYTAEIDEFDECFGEARAALRVVEQSLSPENASTVTVGTPVTFSSDSSQPLSFAIASSPALLATPDVDSGPGSLSPSTQLYGFTSTKASASAGTVYWRASFSTADMPHCAHYVSTEETAVRTLTVVPPAQTSPMSPAPISTPDLTPPVPVWVSISSKRFHLEHPTVTYRIKCSERCTGKVEYELVKQRHYKAVQIHCPDLGPITFSINAPSGGEKQFNFRFTGSALRLLRRLVHNGDSMALELRVSATPVESDGITHAKHTVPLRA
jgi:hypothetical protein